MQDRVNFIHLGFDLFVEMEASMNYKSIARFRRPQPFIVRQPDENGSYKDAGPGPRIMWGRSFESGVHVVIEDTGTNEQHFRIFHRDKYNYFYRFFEMSNDFNNMED